MFESKVKIFFFSLQLLRIDYFIWWDEKSNNILIITICLTIKIVELEKYFNKFRDKKILLESFTMNNHDDSFILLLVNLIRKKYQQKLLKIDTSKRQEKIRAERIICKLSTFKYITKISLVNNSIEKIDLIFKDRLKKKFTESFVHSNKLNKFFCNKERKLKTKN